MSVENPKKVVVRFMRTIDGRGPVAYNPAQVTGDIPLTPALVEAVVNVRAELAPRQPVSVTPKP